MSSEEEKDYLVQKMLMVFDEGGSLKDIVIPNSAELFHKRDLEWKERCGRGEVFRVVDKRKEAEGDE